MLLLRAGAFGCGFPLDEVEIERLLGGPPRLALEGIVGNPRLPEARKAYLDRFLDIYGGDPFLVRLLIESGRFVLYFWVTILDAAQDPARRETWVTVGLLKQTMAATGMASGRHVDQLIARLCEVGFMELRPAEQDRRVRILKPTEKLHAHDRDWLVAHYTPLAVLYPQYDYGLVMRRDPQFQAIHRRTAVAFSEVGRKALMASPDMLLFFDRAAGIPVIMALLQAATDAGDGPHATVPYGDVGERFGVSRTHVRKLLTSAEELGLVKLQARGGHRVEILPRLWSSWDRSIAAGMHFHDMLYVAASRAYAEVLGKRAAAG
jgi:hypothetical protein